MHGLFYYQTAFHKLLNAAAIEKELLTLPEESEQATLVLPAQSKIFVSIVPLHSKA
jgi:hypothetical protein